MTYVPNSGSVVAFQGNPSVLQATVGLMSTNASVITVGTAAANQSVSGTVGASIIGLPPVALNVGGSPVTTTNPVPVQPPASGFLPVTTIGSVIAVTQGSVATVIIGGSIAASFTPPANQSVSGAISVSNFPTTQNVSGSVVAWLASTNASVITVGSPVANQSVSGTVGASVIGTVPVTQVTSPWTVVSSISGGIFPISGSVAATITNFPTNQNVGGSVVAFQGTNPWTINPVSSIAVNIIAGSIAASFTPPANQSVSGAVSVSNFPVTQNVSGSVVATQGTNPWIITGSVQASLTPAANQSVSGTVGASVIGHAPVVIVGGSILTTSTANQSVSGTVGASVLGTVPVTQGTTPWLMGSVYGNISGSVAAFQVGTYRTSILGSYGEDTANTTGDLGLFVLGVRNDTLASVTASNGDYTQFTVGAAGETITSNSPITTWVSGTASMLGGTPVNGGSVALIAAQGASVFTYVTGLQITNPSANTVFLRLDGGTSSTIGFTIAPATGGSNIVFPNPIKTRQNAAFTASISGVASVYLSAQGFTARL